MNANRTVLILGLGFVAGVAWVTWSTRADTVELERRLSDVHAQREQLQSVLRTPAPMSRANEVSETESPMSNSATPETQSIGRVRAYPPGLLDLGRENPQLINLFVANQRSELQQRYGTLFQDLQLTPAQQEQFKDALATHVAGGFDMGAVAKEEGLTFDDPRIERLRAASEEKLASELKAIAGEQAFLAYRDFERGLPVRGFVDGFAVQLATVEPLTAEQTDQLARVLLEASPEFGRGERADPKTLDWMTIDRAAQRFLSPVQFATWQLGVAHNRYGGSRVDLELMRIYEAAKATATRTGP